jgi:hypothetical protein
MFSLRTSVIAAAMTKRATAVVAAVVVATGLAMAGAPSAAAADGATVTLDDPHGATYFHGTLNFTARTATVSGTIHAFAGSCRRVYVFGYDANYVLLDWDNTKSWCTTGTPSPVVLSTEQAGGFTYVVIYLETGDGEKVIVGCTDKRGDTFCTIHA